MLDPAIPATVNGVERQPRSTRSAVAPVGLAVGGLAAGGLAGVAPRLVLPGLVLLALPRLLIVFPTVAAGAYVAAVYLRLPELATAAWDLPSVLSHSLTAVALLAGLLAWIRSGRRPPALATAGALVALLAVAVLVSAFVATDPRAPVVGAGQVVLDATVALAVVLVVRERRHLAVALWALAGAALLVVLLGLYQELTGTREAFGGLAQSSSSTIAGGVTGYRLGGQFGDANFFAQMLLVAVPVTAALAAVASRRVVRAAAAGACLAICVTVLFTYSRGGILVLAALVLLALVWVRPRWKPLTLMALVLALAATVLPWRSAPPLAALADRSASSSSDPSVQQRLYGLETAMGMFAEHPLLGVGYDGYRERRDDYAGSAGLSEPRDPALPPHSLYLHTAAETGVVGLVALLALVLVPLRRLRGAVTSDRPLTLLTWAAGAALGAYFAAATLLPRAYPRQMWLVVGIALAAGGVRVAHSRRASGPRRKTA